MIVSVSTVKDSPQRLATWITRNLANGIDHMVVFVDDSDPAVLAELGSHDHVTVVDSLAWWGPSRPGRLNVRQRLSANAVLAAASMVPAVTWVLHHDADEVAVIDRERLAECADSTSAFKLTPYEAVSQRVWPDDRVTLFKRPLSTEELMLLAALGVVAKPANATYFHGHIGGKVAMRPTLSAWLGTHHMVDADKDKQPAFEAPWLKLLHYESFSADEFVRKWTNLSTSGGPVATRGARSTLAEAIRFLTGSDLAPEVRHDLMLELFDRHVADDGELLDRLGFVEQLDPDLGHRVPSFDVVARDELTARVEALATVDKLVFEPGTPAERIRAAWGDAPAPAATSGAHDTGRWPRRRTSR